MNYYGVTRSTDHLAHYGVKGMKWGVRKAVVRGNDKALDRHFKKAAKKLAKLQDIGLNSGKYAAKATAYGAAAVGTGTLTVGGTKMASKLITKAEPTISEGLKYLANHSPTVMQNGKRIPSKAMRYFATASTRVKGLGGRVSEFGDNKISTGIPIYEYRKQTAYNPAHAKKSVRIKVGEKQISGNALYRIGAGAVTVGLAAKAAQNAYRAANGSKYRRKAYEWKNSMDDTFKGTKYEGQYVVPKKKKKRSR